jgi:hypothetical protein
MDVIVVAALVIALLGMAATAGSALLRTLR